MNATPALRAAIRATSAFRDISEADLAFLIESAEIRFFEPDAVLMPIPFCTSTTSSWQLALQRNLPNCRSWWGARANEIC